MKAVTFYTLGWDEGSLRACALLGQSYEKGEGVTAGERHAAELYGKTCDAGGADACNSLSILYQRGAGGLEKNAKRGFELEECACTLGMTGACITHGMRLLNDIGVPKDPDKGRELLRRVCAAGEQIACKTLERF